MTNARPKVDPSSPRRRLLRQASRPIRATNAVSTVSVSPQPPTEDQSADVLLTAEFAGKFETGAPAPAVPHLQFLDGLRGIAALYVVLHHSYQFSYPALTGPSWLFFLRWGQSAVTVFIAISGYCLALPAVRAGLRLKGGALHFYGKRAHRILPPYYAALAFGIAFCLIVTPAGARAGYLFQPLMRKALLTHLFLVHNWSWEVAYTFNGPLWSVATEMQIYLLFPLILLTWRRFGMAWMLPGAFIVSHAIYFLSGHRGPANYIFVFALGACAAKIDLPARDVRYLKAAFLVCLVAFVAMPNLKVVYSDLLVGTGAACLMNICAHTSFWPGSVLSLKPLRWLGSFAYSIYLIHNVVQHIYLDTALRLPATAAGGLPLFLFLCLVLTPIILGLAYLFHLAIERPFMTHHRVLPNSIGNLSK